MTMLRKKEASILSLAILVTIAALPRPLIASLMAAPAGGQAPVTATYPLPSSVPVGTTIRIGGSSTMETINQALKERFEQQFVGTTVELNTQGTGPALKDVLDGNADLAAIGRALTDQERSQGLIQVPISRHKIAIIVGSENPFKGSLTFEQFAKIFRGEIKDWSQLGGSVGPIRFIDRPDSSDTRQAFRNYAVFKAAPFVTGPNTTQLAQDNTSQVVQALGKDGIGYAIADQLSGRGDVRVIPMHKTLPSSPKYPFSQPLVYVYKGPQPNPSAQAFLGYATAPISRQTIETARKQEAIAPPLISAEPKTPSPQISIASPPPVSPSTTASPAASPAKSDATNPQIPWWLWLLAIPLIGALLWWLLKTRDVESAAESDAGTLPPPIEPVASGNSSHADTVAVLPLPPIGAAKPAGNSRLILVPRSCTDAYAYWEIPDDVKASLQQQNALKPVLRLYDVTGIDIHQHPPESLQEFDCDEQSHDRHVPIRTDNRDYIGELGYIAADGRWLQVARSEPIHVPACPPGTPPVGLGGHVLIEDEPSAVAGNDAQPPLIEEHEPTPEPPTGGHELSPDMVSDTNRLPTVNREPSPPPYPNEVKIAGEALAAGAVLAGAGSVMASDTAVANNVDPTVANVDPRVANTVDPAKPAGEAAADMVRDRAVESHPAPSAIADPNQVLAHQTTRQGRIILVPRNSQDAYVYWEVPQDEKDVLKQQGGQQLVLRVYAANSANAAGLPDQGIQQFTCNDWDQDLHVPITISNRSYVAELGYLTADGQLLPLTKSLPTYIPAT